MFYMFNNYSTSGFYALNSMFIHCLVTKINYLIDGGSGSILKFYFNLVLLSMDAFEDAVIVWLLLNVFVVRFCTKKLPI